MYLIFITVIYLFIYLFAYLLNTDIFIFTHSFYSLSYGNGCLQEENQKRNVCRFENINVTVLLMCPGWPPDVTVCDYLSTWLIVLLLVPCSLLSIV